MSVKEILRKVKSVLRKVITIVLWIIEAFLALQLISGNSSVLVIISLIFFGIFLYFLMKRTITSKVKFMKVHDDFQKKVQYLKIICKERDKPEHKEKKEKYDEMFDNYKMTLLVECESYIATNILSKKELKKIQDIIAEVERLS